MLAEQGPVFPWVSTLHQNWFIYLEMITFIDTKLIRDLAQIN